MVGEVKERKLFYIFSCGDLGDSECGTDRGPNQYSGLSVGHADLEITYI